MGGRQAGRGKGEGGHRASGRQGRTTRSEQAGNECEGAQDDDADKEERPHPALPYFSPNLPQSRRRRPPDGRLLRANKRMDR